MSAEYLRAVAAEMREVAQAASSGPWIQNGTRVDQTGVKAVADCYDEPRASKADARHIAAWHPGVALAVADWLEATAREFDALGDPAISDRHPLDGRRTAALAVARAWRGDS